MQYGLVSEGWLLLRQRNVANPVLRTLGLIPVVTAVDLPRLRFAIRGNG